jgi:tRNA(fMet)-specific endonuclease VapC
LGLLIDSSVFIAAERGAFALGEWLSGNADQTFAISAVTASELLHGVHRAPSGRRRERRRVFVSAILETYPVHPFDLDAATIHAELWAELAAAGQKIGPHDLIIAASALASGFGIATFNQKEFGRIRGLDVVVPE